MYLFKAKIYDIDSGNFDLVKKECILHITNRFIKLKPQAIKSKLAS